MLCSNSNNDARVVLCVDNDPSLLALTKAVLECEGYVVLTATNAKVALEKFVSEPVDAVILDDDMPRMNGVQTALAMKRLNPHVPKLLLVSQPKTTVQTEQVTEAFCDKTDDPRALVPRVRRLLDRAEAVGATPITLQTHIAMARLSLDWSQFPQGNLRRHPVSRCRSPLRA